MSAIQEVLDLESNMHESTQQWEDPALEEKLEDPSTFEAAIVEDQIEKKLVP